MAALADALSFIAGELGAPLATVAGCIDVVASRHLSPRAHVPPGIVQFAEDYPGELMTALDRAQRRAALCQSLLAALVQSTRDAHAGTPPVQRVSARRLLSALLEGFPFEEEERRCVVSETLHDFVVPVQYDLVYIVLCVLTRNAIEALRKAPQPRLRFEISQDEGAGHAGCIRICDNAPVVAPPIQMQASEPSPGYLRGSPEDIGLIFCQRVMRSLGGSVETRSAQGMGTTVTLQFALDRFKQ